jgi:hypothetical protein
MATRRTAFAAALSVGAVLLLGACASVPPSGPSVLVLPGSNKSFEQFRADEQDCRQYASAQLGGATPEQAAVDSAAKSAVVGTAVGAVAGGIIDGRSGAALGAGTGLLFGAMAGAGASQGSARNAQWRYDVGYQQCMYAKGHKVPVAASQFRSEPGRPRRGVYPPPPPPPAAPPPPDAAKPG